MNPLANPSYLLPPLLAALVSGLLCYLVVRRSRGSPARRFFALFLLTLGLWSSFIFLMRSSPDTYWALFWERRVLPVMLASTPSYYLFTLAYTRKELGRAVLPAIFLYLAAIAFLALGGLLVKRMEVRDYGYAPIFSAAFYPVALAAYTWVVYGVVNLYRAYRASPVYRERNRLLYIIVGTALLVAGTAVDILPSVYPTSILGNLAFGAMTTVAIGRYNLLDINLVLRRGLAYLIMSALIALPYVGIILLATQVFGISQFGPLGYVLLLIALALALQPLWGWVQGVVDRLFFRHRRDYLRALEEFSRRTRSTTDLGAISSELVGLVRAVVQADGVCLLLPSEQGEFVPVAASGGESLAGLHLHRRNPLTLWLERSEGPLERHRLELLPHFLSLVSRDRKTLEESGAELLVPLQIREGLSGVLVLGPKLTGRPYSGEELRLLSMIARQTVFLLDDARLYALTHAALHRRVAELEALSGVLTAATRELNLDSIFGEALRRAAEALRVERTAIALLEPGGGQGRVVASFSRGPGDRPGLDRVFDIEEYPVVRRVLESKEPAVVENYAALPPSPQREQALQMGLKSDLLVPLLVGEEAIGLIQLQTLSATRAFTREEVALGQAIAGHLATVIQNARLFQRTERERSILQSIIASMGEGLVVVDAQGRVAYCNRAAEGLLGLRAADFLGQPVEVFLSLVSTRIVEPQEWQRILAVGPEGEVGSKGYFQVHLPERREIEATPFPIKGAGARLGLGVVLRDVTKEREVERMEIEFVSMASHELRTPMTVIYGFVDLLLKSPGIAEEQRQWLERVHRESERLTDIVDDLLNVSRIEAGHLSLKREAVALEPLIAELVGQLHSRYPTHPFYLNIPPDFPPLWADGGKLTQVLYNLLDNALKYSPPEGPVTVTVRRDEDGDGDRAIISVADRGVGIPRVEMPRLFTRFHRIQRLEMEGIRGTGLGLYIVKSLVEMMGGQVWVESKVNEGSTFYLSLPLAEAP